MTGNQIAWANLYETKFHNRRTEFLESEKNAETRRTNKANETIKIFQAKLNAQTQIETTNITARTNAMIATMQAANNLKIARENNQAKILTQRMMNEMTKYSTDVNAQVNRERIAVEKLLGKWQDERERLKIANDTERVSIQRDLAKLEQEIQRRNVELREDELSVTKFRAQLDRLQTESNVKLNTANIRKADSEIKLNEAKTKESEASARQKDSQARSYLTREDQIRFKKIDAEFNATQMKLNTYFKIMDQARSDMDRAANMISTAVSGGSRIASVIARNK